MAEQEAQESTEQENEFIGRIRREFDKAEETSPSGSHARSRVERSMYPELPDDSSELIELLDAMVATGEWKLFWLATMWIKRKGLYDIEYMPYYERWLHEHVDDWGVCDVFCYRVLNPMVERHPELFDKVTAWAESPKTYVRRAAPVCLLESTQTFRVNYDLDKVLRIVEKLKDDEEEHVQKGVGWLLKYSYLTYPKEVHRYLRDNVDNLPRIIFRYALEKAPSSVRRELMSL